MGIGKTLLEIGIHEQADVGTLEGDEVIDVLVLRLHVGVDAIGLLQGSSLGLTLQLVRVLDMKLGKAVVISSAGLGHLTQVLLVILDGIGIVLDTLVGVRQGLDNTCTLVLVVELLQQSLLEHGDGLVVTLQTVQGIAVVHIVHVGDVGRVGLVEQTVGKVKSLVKVALLSVAEHGQTVQSRVARLLLETELRHLDTLVVLLGKVSRESTLDDVHLLELGLRHLVVGSNSLVEVVGDVVDVADDGINRIVGHLCTQVVQLGNGSLRADLTIDGCILPIGIRILRVEVDGLVVECSCTTTVVCQGLDVA